MPSVLMMGRAVLPDEVFHHILSLLTWQDIVNVRMVSRSLRSAVDLHLAQRAELHIGEHDPPVVLDDNTMGNLLRAMPALIRLSVEWRVDGGQLDIDIVTRHCRNLVEIDLTMFRLDPWSLRQLCVACPQLEVVKLPWKSDDSCAEVLLRNLPRLRSLDLAHTKVKGHFLGACHELSERLPLALCDFEMSHGTLHSSGLLAVLTKCPQLRRLSLAHSSISGSSSWRWSNSLRQLNQGQTVLRLRELDVTSVEGLATADLTAILSCSPQLERLWASELGGMELSTCLMQLSNCAELRELDISGRIDESSLWTKLIYPLAAPVSLLHRRDVEVISGNALTAFLSGCRELERLVLADRDIFDSSSLRGLAQCPQLRELDLSRVRTHHFGLLWRPVWRRSVDAADLGQGLSGCPLLEQLSVTELTAPLEQVVPPIDLPRLTYLDAGDKVLTDNTLRRLSGMFPRLHTLIIRDCKSVSEDGLMNFLPRLQNLRSLELENVNGVTDALCERLMERRLSHLRITGRDYA